MLKTSEKSRRQIYYSSVHKITNAENINIKSTQPYISGVEGQYAIDNLSCTLNKGTATYDCKMISTLYNSDATVVRKSYFPGDGFKYTTEGTSRTKSAYDNVNLFTVLSQRLSAASNNYLPYLTYPTSVVNQYDIKYGTSISFHFNSFTISKEVHINHKVYGTKQTIKLGFDSKNHLIKIEDATNKATLELDYNKSRLNIPKTFSGFTEN
jgi:hypothetical protein